MKSKKRWIVVVLICVLVFGGVFGFVGLRNYMMGQFFAQMAIPQPMPVTVAQVQTEQWSGNLAAVGTLQARNGVDVSAATEGIVQEILFEPGQQVKKGQVLVRLDADVERGDLRSAEAQLSLLRTNLDRARDLARTGNVARAALDKAQSEHDAQIARVAALKAVIDKKTVVAPFDGVIGLRQVDVGQYLQAGAPIANLQDLATMLADFAVPQKDLSHLAMGREVVLTTDAFPGQAFAGAVSGVEPRIDPKSGMVAAQARFDNAEGKLRPGLFVKVGLNLPRESAVLTVPATAISYSLYGDSVFVVRQAKGPDGADRPVAERVTVRLGERREGRVAVLDGLKPDDVVVTVGQMKLDNGLPLIPQTEQALIKPAETPKN